MEYRIDFLILFAIVLTLNSIGMAVMVSSTRELRNDFRNVIRDVVVFTLTYSLIITVFAFAIRFLLEVFV